MAFKATRLVFEDVLCRTGEGKNDERPSESLQTFSFSRFSYKHFEQVNQSIPGKIPDATLKPPISLLGWIKEESLYE